MARPIYQYQPINDAPDVSIGILLPMNKSADKYQSGLNALKGTSGNPNGPIQGQQYNTKPGSGGSVFALSYTTEDQAISNLKNLLLTYKGERIMQPEFGTLIRKSIFQPNTETLVEFLRESISNDISRWLPYILIDSIDINRRIDQMAIDFSLRFRVGKTGVNRVINILAQENEISIISEDVEIETMQLTQVSSFSTSLGASGY